MATNLNWRKTVKVNRIIWCLAAVAIIAGTGIKAVAKEEEEEALSMSQLPAAAQKTIKAQVSQEDIQKITKEDEDGKAAFEVKVVKGDKKSEVTVAADGTLLSVEEEVALSDVPEAARKTLVDQIAGGKTGKIEKVTENGKTVYETIIKKGDKRSEIQVDPAGKVVATEDKAKEDKEQGWDKHKDKD